MSSCHLQFQNYLQSLVHTNLCFSFPRTVTMLPYVGKGSFSMFLDDVKDLETERLFWITWVNPALAQQPFKWEREAGGFELEEKQSRYTCGTVPVEAGTGQDTDTPRVSRWSTCSPYPFHSLRPPAPSDVRSMLSPPGMWQLIASATGNNITCPYFACL